MPELPEVESIRKQLEKFLVNHTIQSIEVKNRKIFTGDEKDLINAKVVAVRRFGKVTVIDLSNKISVLIHVKMTGQLIYKGPNNKNSNKISPKVTGGVPGIHTHVIFNLDKGGILYFNDLRRFGWMKIVKSEDLKSQNNLLASLGPEPFRDLKLDYFLQMLNKTRRPIKVVIMDQSKIAGVGNIYANDALWLSKINPSKPAKDLNEAEAKSLFDSIHEVLKEGIKFGGSSENSFVTPDGGEGEYQRHTLVYGKQGTICKHCKKEKIKKVMLGGRGTYFCPSCQK